MRESGVGRVLVASLHQAIAEVLPGRLGFYENWLNTEGLREGTIGLAPLYAVLSFLRQEGDAYVLVTTKAGEYAAEWTALSTRPAARALITRLPAFMRRRILLGRANDVVRLSYDGSRTTCRIRSTAATVEIRGSVFCSVREPSSCPLCHYYAAAYQRMLALFDLRTLVTIESCHATGADRCLLTVPLVEPAAATQPEAA